jgi:hypothetical protein
MQAASLSQELRATEWMRLARLPDSCVKARSNPVGVAVEVFKSRYNDPDYIQRILWIGEHHPADMTYSVGDHSFQHHFDSRPLGQGL